MATFELVKVRTVSQLHENLEKLLQNKSHIESLVVDTTTDEIRVDLSRMANAFGNSDFKLKLIRGKSGEARAILDRLKNQNSPMRSQSEDLFALLDTK
jgi:hypothetical protein